MRRLKRRFVRISTLGALVGLTLAAGCQEPRSYALRWRIEPRPDVELPDTTEPQDEEMNNASICSRSGVSKVEVWVIDELDQVADTFERPCFPERFRQPGGVIRGATIPPGDYTIILAGTRANGLPWGECPGESGEGETPSCNGRSVSSFLNGAVIEGLELCQDGTCNVGLESCDCQEFTVVADKTERLPDFVLAAPPDCEDGIDNDEDGLVDQLDPGCQLGESESTPALSPELSINLSVLSGHPTADCGNIGVGALALSIDDVELEPIFCEVGTSRLTTPLSVGNHTLTITGVQSASTPTPLTVAKSFPFAVNDLGVTEPSAIEVDFSDIDLLEPLEAQVQFFYDMALPAAEGEQAEVVGCDDDRMAATEFRYRILDLGGQEVTSVAVAPADGSSEECTDGRVISLETLEWGVYTAEIEAFNADGELCWSNADAPGLLVPREAEAFTLQPVADAPASCFE